MRVVFMGTPDFAVPTLQALIDSPYEIVGVFTQPDRPKGRGGKVQMSPVKELALKHDIPVFQPLKMRVDGLEPLKELKPDVCVTAAFGQILSQEVLDVPPMGTVNVHASLLPRHRGAGPIQWSILSGDEVAGVTTMFTDKGIDTGDMLLKVETPISEEDTAGTLTDRLQSGLDRGFAFYQDLYPAELVHYAPLRNLSALKRLSRDEIRSTGYVVDTLIAAVWCLITETSFSESLLRAVNLGLDTDTIAAIAGGLAGLHYGLSAVPTPWLNALQRRDFIESLCAFFDP